MSGKQADVSRTISVLVIRELMTRTERVLQTLAYSQFDQLARLLAREFFVEFSATLLPVAL
jgi:hypothetical protein